MGTPHPPGINFFSNLPPGILLSRLRQSQGTRPARPRDSRAPRFRSGAFVPATPWSRVPPDGLGSFCEQGGDWENSRSVCLVRPPLRQRRALERLGLARVPGEELRDPDRLAGAADACLEIIGDFITGSPATRCHGIGVNRPGMVTTSIDYNIDRLVGLHVDHWDGLPLPERSRAGNRLAINIGTSAYYILMMAATLADMARLLDIPASEATDLNRLPDDFMARFPTLPVWQVRIEPNDLYVAPTDNIIHDGSTRGGRSEARQIVFRGALAPTARLIKEMAPR